MTDPSVRTFPEPESEGTRRRRRRRRTERRRRIVLAAIGLGLLLVLLAAGLAAARYLPALDDARSLRGDLDRLIARARDSGLDLDRPALDAMRADMATAQARFGRMAALLESDPLAAVGRMLPLTQAPLAGADAVSAAGSDLLAAANDLLGVGDHYVTIRERQAGDSTDSALADLVELMATGRDEMARAVSALDRADAALAAAPTDLPGPLAEVRDLMQARIGEYGPVLRAYAKLDDGLPAILGWDGPRRYLVLTQNPAELRPTGGFIGSFGVVAFARGRITERNFQDVFLLDLPWDYPFVEPPPALRNYLLGPDQPWQLADANWSPDFPASAQQAVTLYTNEGGKGPIDGVLAITTHTIDELLEVTGPITVPDYDVTIAPGETTLTTLQNTRGGRDPEENRKAFLAAFADQLFANLLSLPPDRWTALAGRGEAFRAQRLLQAWFADPASQAVAAESGFDGTVRDDRGDFIYPVDSNVAPVSKLNAVTDRDLELTIQLDEFGNARNDLAVTWTNRIETEEARPYRELPFSEDLRVLGMYFRLLVPERSRVEAASGGSTSPITAPAEIGEEAGRTLVANYLRIPPGSTTLRYAWVSPYPVELAEDGTATYRLTVQKQPGLLPGRLTLRIGLPPGATLIEASSGLTVEGRAVTLQATFDRDFEVGVRYRSAGVAP